MFMHHQSSELVESQITTFIKKNIGVTKKPCNFQNLHKMDALEGKARELRHGLAPPKEYLLGLAVAATAKDFEDCLDKFKFSSGFSMLDHIELELAMRKFPTRDVHVAFLQVFDFALSRDLISFDVEKM